MSFLAIDKDGSEFVYEYKPCYQLGEWRPYSDPVTYRDTFNFVELPKGSIECLTGLKMTYQSEPFELKLDF
jgi:hypothetical protein